MVENLHERCLVRGTQYLLDDFMKLVGLGRHAMRAARKAGMRVLRAHGRTYVNSDDWFEYLDKVCSKNQTEDS